MSSKRKIKCKFCDAFFYTLDDYASHIEKYHKDMMRNDMTPKQFAYFLITGKAVPHNVTQSRAIKGAIILLLKNFFAFIIISLLSCNFSF